jgi:hypothetical protein
MFTYVGNCVDSFDDAGDCIIDQLPYYNVSDFAVNEENAKEVTAEEFTLYVDIPEECRSIHALLDTIHLYDSLNQVYMLYDTDMDVHYFFI